MNTTIDSMIQRPIATRIRHRGALAIAAGIAVVGVVASGAVLVDDHDASDPAPPAAVTTPAATVEDPLVTRYGEPSTPSAFHDAAERDRLRMLAARD